MLMFDVIYIERRLCYTLITIVVPIINIQQYILIFLVFIRKSEISHRQQNYAQKVKKKSRSGINILLIFIYFPPETPALIEGHQHETSHEVRLVPRFHQGLLSLICCCICHLYHPPHPPSHVSGNAIVIIICLCYFTHCNKPPSLLSTPSRIFSNIV